MSEGAGACLCGVEVAVIDRNAAHSCFAWLTDFGLVYIAWEQNNMAGPGRMIPFEHPFFQVSTYSLFNTNISEGSYKYLTIHLQYNIIYQAWDGINQKMFLQNNMQGAQLGFHMSVIIIMMKIMFILIILWKVYITPIRWTYSEYFSCVVVFAT